METRKTLSSFVIEGAMKEDEGSYSITVTNPAGEDKAELFVKIVGRWIFITIILFYLLTSLILPTTADSNSLKLSPTSQHLDTFGVKTRVEEGNRTKQPTQPRVYFAACS